jgi:preprotein translocase subunit SecE
MATEEDLKKSGEPEEGEEESEEQEAPAKTDSLAPRSPDAAEKAEASESASEEEEADVAAPVQLGYQRYVYAAYMAGALIAAFLFAKIGHASWYRLGQWKTELGEPKDEYLFPVAGVLGVAVAIYYWRKPDARKYADEVAEELSKVTWPTRKEVTNSTTVVVLTTLFATVFFALMDRFWGFITDKIYTF